MPRLSKKKRDEARFGKPQRLADAVSVNGCITPQGVDKRFLPIIRTVMSQSIRHPFDISNVYAFAESRFLGKAYSYYDDIPCAGLPFDSQILEWDSQDARFGYAIARVENRRAIELWSQELVESGLSRHENGEFHFAMLTGRPKGSDSKVICPLAIHAIHLDSDRRMAAAAPLRIGIDSYAYESESFLFVAYLAIAFISCKNVQVLTNDPPREINRERRKAGLKPFVRYHTIEIEPMKQILRTEGGIEEHGLQRALHICRGHFATYSTSFMGRPLEKPMTVWRPAHVRGSEKEGIVISDYEVSGLPTT